LAVIFVRAIDEAEEGRRDKGSTSKVRKKRGEKPYENPYPLEKFKGGGDREMRKGIQGVQGK